MDKIKESKNLNNIDIIAESNNPEDKEKIITNMEIENIYSFFINFENNKSIKYYGFQDFYLFFDQIYNKIKNLKPESPEIIKKRNLVINKLAEELINYMKENKENLKEEKAKEYFFDKNFSNIFLENLIKKEEYSFFEERFKIFSIVSNITYNYKFDIFQLAQKALNDNLEINNLFKVKIINELFNQYDSISNYTTNIIDNNENINIKKSNIIKKLNLILDEFNKKEINIKNISIYIDNLLKQRNLNKNNNNIINTNNKEEINAKLYKNNKNEIKIEKNTILNIYNEPNKKDIYEEFKKLIKEDRNQNNEENKINECDKEEKELTGKKRAREKRKIVINGNNAIKLDEGTNEEKSKKKDIKKKTKKKKVNNKENENKNSNKINQKEEKVINKKNSKTNSKQSKSSKKEQNNKNNRTTQNKSKNKTIKNSKKNTKSPIKETNTINLKEIKSPNKKNSNKISLNSKEEIGKNKKKMLKIMEKIQKVNCESELELNQKNLIEKENNISKPKKIKSKKKNKKKINNFIIDEELKKSTPIRNLKKTPKGILKKTSSIQTFILASPPPKSQYRSKSSDKKVTFTSESKDKKFKTFAEIFQSPSKLKATPLKRKINSEKKSSHKKNNILLIDDNNNNIKNDFIGKKRNITFNNERIVKEYNPKTPVRDVKQRSTRKSPLERKKVNTN